MEVAGDPNQGGFSGEVGMSLTRVSSTKNGERKQEKEGGQVGKSTENALRSIFRKRNRELQWQVTGNTELFYNW